jgi:hypothetical protein
MLRLVEDESTSAIARECARRVIADMLRFNLVSTEDLV